MKTIAIIGGMGPQASIHAHTRLIEKLADSNVTANIVHVTLVIEPFHSSQPKLQLNNTQKELLGGINADIGFIACNTAHLFFDELQSLVQFEMVHMINNAKIPSDAVIICSPSSRNNKLFGDRFLYASDDKTNSLGKLIHDVIEGRIVKSGLLEQIVGDVDSPVFACTEISMIAHRDGLAGYDTLENTLEEVVKRIS